jgi:hypothetical protein
VENLQPVATDGSVQHWIELDGVFIINRNLSGGMAADEQLVIGSPTATTVRAGRHTLTLRVDGPDGQPENDEGNNKDGSQWIWEPPVLAAGPAERTAPPDPRGGFGTVPWETTFYFNRDGIRTPVLQPDVTGDGQWHAVAALPRNASDVDVTLYEASTGPQDGFDDALAWSGWGMGDTDFVLVNLHGQSPRSFDAGFYRAEGSEDYTVEVVGSSFRGAYPSIDGGPFTLGGGRVLDLHEVFLEEGGWTVELSNLGGDADLGLSAYRAGDGAFFGKSDHADGAISWYDGDGADEAVTLVTDTAGYVLLAVWKTERDQAAKNADYAFVVEQTVGTDAPSVAPVARTALTRVQPNPFNPRTVVHFELAESAPVDLMVYDVRGQRVRVLAAGEAYPAGRHEAIWNGLDDAGRRVASGTYLVVLRAPGVRDQAKATLLK